jgi:hypothetical protein
MEAEIEVTRREVRDKARRGQQALTKLVKNDIARRRL